MKYLVIFCTSLCLMVGCTSKKTPNVSNVQVNVSVNRFEKDFFSLDTNNLDNSLQKLYEQYGIFYIDFLQNILATGPNPDTIKNITLQFIQAYRKVYVDSKEIFSNFTPIELEIKRAFQYIKYYFPQYNLPTKLITYIGPWDASFTANNNTTLSAIFRDSEVLGIGLQLSLGNQYPIYKAEPFQQFYPGYISRKFTKDYISVNATKVIIDDLYREPTIGKSLIEQMIEAGKKLYLLDAFLPLAADSLKTGYTQQQLNACYDNEAAIWSFFITNNLLFSTEPALIQEYITDGPKTSVFGEESPGFIGQFVGWQIVKKWMEKKNKPLQELLQTPAKQIFEESKYKP